MAFRIPHGFCCAALVCYTLFWVALAPFAALGQVQSGGMTMVGTIPSAGRMTVPESLTFTERQADSTGWELSSPVLVHLSIRPDKSASLEALIAEWQPDVTSITGADLELSESESVLPLDASNRTRFAISPYSQAFRMRVRAQLSSQAAGLAEVASLNTTRLGNDGGDIWSPEQGFFGGGLLSRPRDLPPGVGVLLAIFPAKSLCEVGVKLEFEMARMLLVARREGIVVFTLAVL